MWVENWGICRGEKKKKLKMGRNKLTAYVFFFFFLEQQEKKEFEVVKDLDMWGWSSGMAKEVDPEDHI